MFPGGVEFRLLGPLEVLDGDRVLPIGGKKRRAVLALLLLAANRVVPTARLIDEVWGESPPRAAPSSLQNHVSRLRAVLGGRLETRPSGYLLRVAPDELDLERFRRLVADARRSDPQTASELLRTALAQWRGSPLADLVDEPAGKAAAHLDELRLAAFEDRIDSDLALGRHAELVPELEALVAEYPFRERFRSQLVLALYRSGRQGDALEAYAAARRTLVEELGAEPGRELQELQRLVLRHDATLDAPPVTVSKAAARPAVVEARKTVTVLLADLAAIMEPADLEARREALRRHWETAERTVAMHGGTAEPLGDDRLLGVFGVPVTHDDDALRAVRAAFDLLEQRVLSRAAITTGDVITGDPGRGQPLVSGGPLEEAERLRAGAGPGEIVAAERMWRLVRHAVSAGSRDGVRILEELEKDAPALLLRLEAPIVGREHELAEITSAFRRATREQRAHLVTVFGPPGIGKTRLAIECTARLQSSATCLTGRCPAYGEDTTYAPLRDALSTVAGGDVPGWLAALMRDEPDGELVAARVAAAIGEGSEPGPVDETAWATRSVLEALARRHPVVLVLEDIHWATPEFLDVVEHVVELARAPMLVLCLARPDLLDVRPQWGGGALNATSLLLDAISTRAADTLLTRLVPEGALDGEGRARILDVAEGNPLFLEQLLAAALEGEAETVPDSIRTLLEARLDRLDEGEREVVQAAAVWGETFAARSVSELVGRDAMGSLVTLARRELVTPAGRDDSGEETWAFRHTLIREEAYRMMPKRRRADLHEASARWIASRADEGGVDVDAIAGYHLERAVRERQDLGEKGASVASLAGEAGRRLAAAGLRARERYELQACVSLLGRAADLLPEESPERDRILPALVGMAFWAGDRGASRRLAEQTLELANRRGDKLLAARILVTNSNIKLWTDPQTPPEQLLAEATEALPILGESGDDEMLALAHMVRFHAVLRAHGRGIAVHLPPPERGELDILDRAVFHGRRSGSQWVYDDALDWVAVLLRRGPLPVEEATARVREILAEAQTRHAYGGAMGTLGILRAMQGAFDEARPLVDEMRRISADLGLIGVAAAQSIECGEVELMAGDLPAAERILREGYADAALVGDEFSLANVAWRLALVLSRLGRDEEAEDVIRAAKADEVGGTASSLWSLAIRATLAARRGDTAEAERLVHALRGSLPNIAAGMRIDLLLEAAEALRVIGRQDEAREMLAEAVDLASYLGYTVAHDRALEAQRALTE
jgi:DNA-binding SARP family transcriptional activator/tetratricopeptide (TPR) repeat protein